MTNFLILLRKNITFLLQAWLVLCTLTLSSQIEPTNQNPDYKDNPDFQNLISQGYKPVEIFEDLGNVKFITGKYEEASYWYTHFFNAHTSWEQVPDAYLKRYQLALASKNKDGAALNINQASAIVDVKSSYIPTSENTTVASNLTEPVNKEFLQKNLKEQILQGNWLDNDKYAKQRRKDYGKLELGLSVTAKGDLAYFSMEKMVKPTTGIFSKKKRVYRIYRAEIQDGEIALITELNLCPNDFSAMHPAVSPDGEKLFFASNMPGSYGNHDIYLVNLKSSGDMDKPKNLGEKINTAEDEIFPKILQDATTLTFASNGRQGFGGMDIYAASIRDRQVSIAEHLGRPINSQHDDYMIDVSATSDLVFVHSNRKGKNAKVSKLAIALRKKPINAKATNNWSRTHFEDDVP